MLLPDFPLFYNCPFPLPSREDVRIQFLQEETFDLSQLASESHSEQGAAEARRLSVFLMTNTLEVGGSERQFATLVESLSRDRFNVHPACLRRIGGLSARLGDIPEFPPGGRLVSIQSQRAQLAMMRSMRRLGVS